MNKIFTLFLCSLAVVLASCEKSEENPNSDALQFGATSVTGITDTSANVSCEVISGAQWLGSFETGFAYGAPGAEDTAYTYIPAVTFTGDMMSGALTGLTEATSYKIFAYAQIGDSYVLKGLTGDFTTTDSGGEVPPPIPPVDANTRYAGWAELPSEVSKPGEYYFAYHLCPDVYVSGSGSAKRRNYAVCYSNELKCAIWVAAPMHDCYVGGSGRTDAYKPDPTISISQPGKWSGYTRGHMLGSGERTASKSVNQQVFYHSNIAPQLGQPYFNTGGGAWNTIEDWVDTQWKDKSDTTYQVIGSYWANKNKKVSGTTIPTHYYKILLRTKSHKNKWVVNCSRDELQCIAIMVEHKTYAKNEVAKPSEYQSKGMLYTVKQMEEKTGQTFFANVPNAPKDTYNVSDWGL